MKLTLCSALTSCAAIGVLALSASAQTFSVATPGAAGAVPAAGTGGGTFSKTANCTPVSPCIVPVPIPVPITCLNQLEITVDTVHTWVGDLQIVLVEPGGTIGHNVMVRPGLTTAGAAGNSGDLTPGVFKFVTLGGGAVPHTAATNMPAGVYNEDFGDPGSGLWMPGNTIGGAAGIAVFNGMPCGPLPSGIWQVHIYDWAGGDVGHIAGVRISVNGPKPPPPVNYCTAKANSLAGNVVLCPGGGIPSLTSSGISSATAPSGFVLTTTQAINNKPGIYLYSAAAPVPSPFQGGFLCLSSPLKRAPPINSGGNAPPNDCSGVFTMDMNALAATMPPPGFLNVVGQVVSTQCWGRDPGDAFGSLLSNGLQFTVGP